VVLCTMVKTREMHRLKAYSTSEPSPVGGVVLTKMTPEDEYTSHSGVSLDGT